MSESRTLNETRAHLLEIRAAWVQVLEIAHRQLPELTEEATMRIEALETTLELIGQYITSAGGRS